MKNKSKFSFELDKDKLKKFKYLSALEKLIWLEQINIFLHKVLTQKQKKLWQKIRSGQF